MNSFQGLKALVQQERGVVDQHVDVANKLFSRAVGETRTVAGGECGADHKESGLRDKLT